MPGNSPLKRLVGSRRIFEKPQEEIPVPVGQRYRGLFPEGKLVLGDDLGFSNTKLRVAYLLDYND